MWDSFEDLMPTIAPAMDMYETKSDVIVEAPLAGVKPEEVEVTVEKGVLTLKGESKKEHEVDDKNYYRKEVRSGSFSAKSRFQSRLRKTKSARNLLMGC
jgi:HSP20 family protein